MEKKFKYKNSFTLNIFYEAYKQGDISDNEKAKLKGKTYL
jgi:hypothetical protein